MIKGLDAVVGALTGFNKAVRQGQLAGGRCVAMRWQTLAKRNAPKSPTKKQYSKTLKRKRITSRKGFFLGGLERSIQTEVLPDGGVSCFVAKNSEAGDYAKRIHDEKGVSWHRRGAGTVAKGAQADEKFIERAMEDNADEFGKLYDREIRAAIARL